MIATVVTYMHASYISSISLFYSLLYYSISAHMHCLLAPSLPRPVHLHLQRIYRIYRSAIYLTICQVYRAVYQLVSISQLQNVPQERHRHDSIHPLVHVVERAAALQHKYDMAVYLSPSRRPSTQMPPRKAEVTRRQASCMGVLCPLNKQRQRDTDGQRDIHTHTERQT
jgi:hypothetical protein